MKIDAKEKNFKKIRDYLGYPLVVKPINEGSSLDVYICNNKLSLLTKMKRMKHYREILLEKFIPGREIQVAIMNKNSLGAIELKPKRKFYDYKAKYNSRAKTEHIIPVKLSKKNYKKINDIALAHRLLNCRGVTRSILIIKINFILEQHSARHDRLILVPEIAPIRE